MNAAIQAVSLNPFPGLRPFREDEEPVFFGRESQVDMMVDKLAATRLLAVVGTSGSGKSSLVNCGVIPALHRGLMAAAGSAWLVALFRPGNRPLRALAQALARPEVLGSAPAEGNDDTGFAAAELLEATLRMGRLGLVDAFEQAHLEPRQRLLVVVDQFEELFRYQALATTGDEAATRRATEDVTAFVNLLLKATEPPSASEATPRIYVVLTMRSDFLGDCAQFFGLPEAINRGQYLVPRMTREERRLAITGPLGMGGAEIEPVLLTRLVNDVGDNPDQLSLLQHALNRTWAQWCEEGGKGPIALSHYEAIGTMAHALDRHAEEAYAELGRERLQQVCASLFKAITDKTTDARGTRRPTRLDTLVAITGAEAVELTAVIDVFREPSRSFLMPPAGMAIAGGTPIDIAHESLMRVWKRLHDWADEEARSAQTYRRLAEIAELEGDHKAALLRDPDLQFAIDWRERQRPTAVWATRYRAGYDALMAFLRRSEEAQLDGSRAEEARRAEQKRLTERERRTHWLLLVGLPLLALMAGALIAMVKLYMYADEQRDIAVSEAKTAKTERQRADEQARAADTARRVAEESAATARRAVNSQREQTLLYKQVTSDAPALRSKIEQAVASKSLVYLQFADPSQQSLLEKLRVHLAKVGYSTPGFERVNAVPSRTELRYFREADADDAEALAALLKRWNWGPLKARLVKGYEGQSLLRQFEIWLARPDEAEMTRAFKQLDASGETDRKGAGQTLQDRYTTTTSAIQLALVMLAPDRIDSLSTNGRINVLYFLTRTAPLAWNAALEAQGREALSRIRSGNSGPTITAELARLERLLDAVNSGAAGVAE